MATGGTRGRRIAIPVVSPAIAGVGRRLLALLTALTLLVGGLAGSRGAARADGCAGDGAFPYLRACGVQIVDGAGAPVRLRAVNWYGFDSNDFVAGGLRYQSYRAIVDHIKALGFNAIRIPFSDELVARDPVVSALGPICVRLTCLPNSGADALGPNNDLYGRDALSILKTIVDYAGARGLYTVLDNHRSQAGWGPQENGLWFTNLSCKGAARYSCYTPGDWLADWDKLGKLFGDDPAVVGMDLRNEPRAEHPPSTCSEYLNSAHWGPCGGNNNDTTDWPRAAARAGNLLLTHNPHWLIFVEGVSTYPQADGSFPLDGFGENLQGAATDPVNLDIAGRLVYAPHDYRVYQNNDSVAQMYGDWTRNFGYLAVPGQPYSAPLWLGEIGTCTYANTCIQDGATGNKAGFWFSALMTYLDNPPSPIAGPLSWSYWPVNGTYSDSWSYSGSTSSQHWRSCYGQRESFGLLGADWSTLSAPLLQGVLFPATAAPSTPTPTATNTASATATSTSTATPQPPTDTPTLSATATTTPTTMIPTATPRATPVTPTATATVPSAATPSATVAVAGTVQVDAPTGAPVSARDLTAEAAGAGTATITTTAPALTTTPATMTATAPPTPAPTATATATTPTATAPPTPAPTATAPPTPAPTATATTPPTATFAPPRQAAAATPPPAPSQWSSFSCAPYTVAPTAAAPHSVKTLHQPLRPARHAAARRPRATPPLLTAHGSALRKRVLLDLLVRRDARGRLGGALRYSDLRDPRRGKGMRLREGTLRTLTIACGGTQTATLTASLRDGKRAYAATLRLTLDARRRVRFSLRLGKTYSLSTALAGAAVIACPPARVMPLTGMGGRLLMR